MDHWDGLGHVVFWMLSVAFLPFLVALVGRDWRLKLTAFGLCLVALCLTGCGMPETLAWGGASVAAGLAVFLQFREIVDGVGWAEPRREQPRRQMLRPGRVER